MSLSQWLQQLRSRQLSGLDARIARLELKYEKLAQTDKAVNPREPAPTVVIEHVNIERLHIDKLEHSNNFGALGIKDLGGKLNIGVNYSVPFEGEEWKELITGAKKSAAGKQAAAAADSARPSTDPPICNIRPKAL